MHVFFPKSGIRQYPVSQLCVPGRLKILTLCTQKFENFPESGFFANISCLFLNENHLQNILLSCQYPGLLYSAETLHFYDLGLVLRCMIMHFIVRFV